jgi:hypothetical protein
MHLIKPLPDPFMMQNGRRVASCEDWHQRRQELTEMMLNVQYGTMPGPPQKVVVQTGQTQSHKDGHSSQKLRFEFTPSTEAPALSFGMDATAWHPAPACIAQRQATVDSFATEGIPALVYVGDRPFDSLCTLLDKGYMVVCFENNQLEPMEMGNPIVGPARTAYQTLAPDVYSWGSIAVWAWGASRIVDYLQDLDGINPHQIMVSGHSRNGKTALLAGAIDTRIALVNPAGSGCAGAGSYLALGADCEDLAALTSRQRWWAWTHADFERWVGHEHTLPFDQHFLMGLVAPRPLLRAEGTTDEWANPQGTCVSFLATEPIYQFLDASACNGIFFHEGGHDHTAEDLEALVTFADRYFFGLPTDITFKQMPPDWPAISDAFDWKCP